MHIAILSALPLARALSAQAIPAAEYAARRDSLAPREIGDVEAAMARHGR